MTRNDFILASIATLAAFDADRARAFEEGLAPMSLERAVALAKMFGATYDAALLAITPPALGELYSYDVVPLDEALPMPATLESEPKRKGRKRGA